MKNKHPTEKNKHPTERYNISRLNRESSIPIIITSKNLGVSTLNYEGSNSWKLQHQDTTPRHMENLQIHPLLRSPHLW